MIDDEPVQKLVMVIVSANDGERLMQLLVQQRLPATKIGSSGGFLRRGNVTILSGVAETRVPELLAAVERTCPRRTEVSPSGTLPLPGAGASGQPHEVSTGGAVVFVLDVERFERM